MSNEACASPRRGPSKWVLPCPQGLPTWAVWGKRVRVHGQHYRVAQVAPGRVTLYRESPPAAPCAGTGTC